MNKCYPPTIPRSNRVPFEPPHFDNMTADKNGRRGGRFEGSVDSSYLGIFRYSEDYNDLINEFELKWGIE